MKLDSCSHIVFTFILIKGIFSNLNFDKSWLKKYDIIASNASGWFRIFLSWLKYDILPLQYDKILKQTI